ncbi:Chromatin-remodeling ATPase INO80 [Labeo rohita]|uniref:Chromatin-remodeling ATPase INO80 n=1 Tax=Labeo rohita TaxID=84645 RepID=A0ABQ8M7X2_LABRO|nr:Chromatin-remodeling ATPase INO80 [Labeo rohita]
MRSTLQLLCSHLAHHLCGGLTTGLPVSICVMAGGSPVSASSLRVLNSASACRPSSSIMAPSSLLSAVVRQSTGSAKLPRPFGSALVCCRPSCALGLHSFGCTLSLRLHQVSFIPLPPPGSSIATAPLQPFGSTPPCRSPEPLVPPRRSGFSSSPWLIGSLSLSWAPLLLVSPLESSALPPPWLLPPLAVAWVPPGSSRHLIRPGSSYFLLGSSLNCLHPGLCSSSSFHPPEPPLSPHLCFPNVTSLSCLFIVWSAPCFLSGV